MKVLHVVPSYWPATVYGGPIFSIHAVCQALARVGVDVRVATTNANGDTKLDMPRDSMVEFCENYRVRYYNDTIINRFSWDFANNLLRDIRDADIVHLQDVFSTHAALAFLFCALSRKPLVVSTRGVLTPWALRGKRPWLKRLWLAMLVKPFVRDSARVVWHATSQAEADEIAASIRGASIRVIANGIELPNSDQIAPMPRAAWLERFLPGCTVPAETAVTLAAMGRLHSKKAFDVAIEVLARLTLQDSRYVLAIAGPDDGEAKRLETQIESAGLAGRASLCGAVDGETKWQFLSGADLFLFTSHNENFGMVVLEALACGVAVIASSNTPWQELETAGSGCWVANEPVAFAEAARVLMARDRATMHDNARANAASYDLNVIARRFRQLYGEMIDGGHDG